MGKSPSKRAVAREQGRIERLESVAVLATQQLFQARIMLARAHGYIDRVREKEAAPAEPVMTDGIEKLRLVLGNGAEHEASAVLDALSPELLARVLGKPDVPEPSSIFP